MSQPPEGSPPEPETPLPTTSPPTILLVLAYFLSVLMLCTSCFCVSAGSWARIESEGELRVMHIHDLILAVFLYLTWRVLSFAFDLKRTWFVRVWFPLTLISIVVGSLMLLHEVQWRVRTNSARHAITRGILFKVKEALERHATDTGAFPEPEGGLDALVNPTDNPGWKGPYLEESHLRDLWGNPIRFRVLQGQVTVLSNGPDGQPDTADDVRFPRP